MRKIYISLFLAIFVTGCAETVAFLGPASTAAGGGNLARSTFTTALDYGIKKSTGKSSIEHAIGCRKTQPWEGKIKCVNFLEMTETEVCKIFKKRVLELKAK